MLTILTVIALLILFALLHRIYQVEREFRYRLHRDYEEREERDRRRERARRALGEAIKTLHDPEYEKLDFALGTGHGVARAERIMAAKTWEEVEAIACGDDLETERDKLEFFADSERKEKRWQEQAKAQKEGEEQEGPEGTQRN